MNNSAVRWLATLLIAVAAFGLGWLAHTPTSTTPLGPASSGEAGQVSLMIDYGDGSVKSFTATANGTENLFDVLKRTADANGITLDYKDYGGDLGVFVEGIGGKKGGAQMWWQYWVNGSYSPKGVSSYVPQEGDVIEFKLIKGQEGQ